MNQWWQHLERSQWRDGEKEVASLGRRRVAYLQDDLAAESK